MEHKVDMEIENARLIEGFELDAARCTRSHGTVVRNDIALSLTPPLWPHNDIDIGSDYCRHNTATSRSPGRLCTRFGNLLSWKVPIVRVE